MFAHIVARLAIASAVLAVAAESPAATIWTGPRISFSKADFAEPSNPANQDRITSNVAITRGDRSGIYNAVLETQFSSNSPADTEWAFPLNNPGLEVSALNFAALSFAPWQTAHGRNAEGIAGLPSVVHLISEDIYLDLMVTSWTSGQNGGGFSYIRSTPVPATPASWLLGLSSVLALGIARRRRWLG